MLGEAQCRHQSICGEGRTLLNLHRTMALNH
jgi:hypothetical protein